ncbi:hypothetical protein ABGB14_35770 [Nonomuraea sp. B10E15]|uniref:hypothetical protein n=1 Tax=Nonomuraea sp. B10E15 TaxID=3153560 RepID=UPI00325F6B92
MSDAGEHQHGRVEGQPAQQSGPGEPGETDQERAPVSNDVTDPRAGDEQHAGGQQIARHEQLDLGVAGSLAALRFDTAVIGCCGLSAAEGLTAYDLDDAAVKKTGIASSRRIIVATDSSKFGRTAYAYVGPTALLHTLVTDTTAPADEVAALESYRTDRPGREDVRGGVRARDSRLVLRSSKGVGLLLWPGALSSRILMTGGFRHAKATVRAGSVR